MNAPPKHIVLAGGSGFLGRLLAKHFVAQGDDVVVLTRFPRPGTDAVRELAWDGKSPGPWCDAIDGADVVINLAGRSVDCRYNATNQRAILESRTDSTRVLGEVIGRCRRPPAVWLNSSTATIYKHSLKSAMDETGEIGATAEARDAFSITVARAWEAALAGAQTPHTRKLALRTAMVLGRDGGVFPVLRRLTRFGLGGAMAGGRQYVSWIHETDFCRALDWLIARPEFSGAVNVAAPHPLPNREMMLAFREACGVPIGLPTTARMLDVGAWMVGTEPELIIKSRRVVPGRLLASGFEFQFRTLAEAVSALASRSGVPPRKRAGAHHVFFEMP